VRRRGKAKRRQSETGFFVVFATIKKIMFYNRPDETMTLLKTLSQDTVYLNNLIITQTIFSFLNSACGSTPAARRLPMYTYRCT